MSSPIDIRSTPVSATWRTFCSVMPPDASSKVFLLFCWTTFCMSEIVMLSSMTMSASACIASVACVIVSTSISSLAVCGAFVRACAMISLMVMPSFRIIAM